MNPTRLLDLFCELVRIDSPSRHEAAMAARCECELLDLGFEVRFDDAAEKIGSDTGNLIAYRAGEREGQLILSAHLDTVEPGNGVEPVVCDGVIRSAGDTILAADDKAGIAGILEALRCCIRTGEALPDVWILFTVCEELSLLGSGALAHDALPAGAPCYVFDASGTPGCIIVGSPCHYTLRATFTGRAAHAGVNPETGISAISMAAAAIDAMPLGRLDEVTTANIGVISGGLEANVVCETCSIVGECRSIDTTRALVQKEVMTEALEAAAKRFGGEVDIDWTLDYDALVYEESDPVIQKAVKAVRLIGLTPQFCRSGGGADANILATRGTKAVTLAIGMSNVHSTEEYITIEDLNATARLAQALLLNGEVD